MQFLNPAISPVTGMLEAFLYRDVINALAKYHPRFLRTMLRGVFSIVFILFLDWRLGLISIAIGAVALQVNLRLTKPMHGMAQKIQKTLETCTARLTDLLAGMRVIHMFPGAKRMLDMYEEANEDVAGQTVRRYGRQGTVSAVGGMFGFASSIGMLLVGILMVRANMVDLGTVMAVSSMQGSVSWFLRAIGSVWGSIKESFVLGERVLQVLDEPKEPQKYDTP